MFLTSPYIDQAITLFDLDRILSSPVPESLPRTAPEMALGHFFRRLPLTPGFH